MVHFLHQDQWDVDMDASDFLTLADEDNDAPNLWQTRRHDLALQDMPPLVTDSDGSSDDDDSSFTTASQDIFNDEMSTNSQVEACNVTKLKITTPVEERQPHSRYVN